MSFQSSLLNNKSSQEFLKSETTEWIFRFREKAFQQLLLSDFPNPSMESWRKISLSNFDPMQFEPYRLTHENLTLDDEVSYRNFGDVSGESESLLVSHLEQLLKKSSGDFSCLYNLTFFSCGLFIEIQENSEIENPIRINYNLLKSKNMLFPLTIVRAGKFSKARIVEDVSVRDKEEMSLVNSFTYLSLEDSSQITYVSKEKFEESVFHFRNMFTVQKKDSSLKNFYFNMGGYKGKTIIESGISEKGGLVESYGACALAKREFLDTDVRINHNAGNTESRLLMKVVAKEKSHHVFTGNLNIPRSSERVVASQMNKNLILNKTARAESIPKLEVFAHDVKCSHGATAGEIKDEEMFYLYSRGLKEDEARALIVEGFFSEILDKLGMESESIEIRDYILKKLFGDGEI